jgi:hypothetical protein
MNLNFSPYTTLSVVSKVTLCAPCQPKLNA